MPKVWPRRSRAKYSARSTRPLPANYLAQVARPRVTSDVQGRQLIQRTGEFHAFRTRELKFCAGPQRGKPAPQDVDGGSMTDQPEQIISGLYFSLPTSSLAALPTPGPTPWQKNPGGAERHRVSDVFGEGPKRRSPHATCLYFLAVFICCTRARDFSTWSSGEILSSLDDKVDTIL